MSRVALIQQLERATLQLRCDVASMRLQVAAKALSIALERRYRPDQPRVPAGVPEGGQWTDASPSMSVAVGYGRVVFGGNLIRQNYESARDVTERAYYDSREDYVFWQEWSGRRICPGGAIH